MTTDPIKRLEELIAAEPNDAVRAILETAHWKAGGLISPPAGGGTMASPEYAPPGAMP